MTTTAKKATTGEKHTIEETSSSNGPRGRITMAEDVVAMIAGIAARQVDGIHSVGKSRLLNIGSDSPARGVAAEVGQKEAAVDLEVVIEHGCDMRKIAAELRKNIADQVDRMTGRKVVEVNIDVIGIHLPEEEEAPEEPKAEPAPRVR